jgi:uncharacterized protein
MTRPTASGPNRRAVLGALAAAGAPLAGRAAPLRKVAVIGGGMAGVACAWLLDDACEVVLIEAAPALGGNVRSVDVLVDGQSYRVDAGAQYFHPGPYPTYVQLLETLGLYPPATGGSHAFPASITVADPAEGRPRFVSPVLPGRAWPLLAAWNRPGLEAFNRSFSAALRREERDASWQLTLGDWLPTLGLDAAQWEGAVLPWAASIFSGDIEQARGLSARAAMVFAAKALPPKATDPILYYVVEQGMIEVLERMVAQFTTVQMLVGAPVTGVARVAGGGFVVQLSAGPVLQVDEVVFAASGPPTLGLLGGISGTAAQRAALQGIEFFDARLMLHTDPAYAPASPNHWSFLNCRIEGDFCEASMWLAKVLTPAPGASPPGVWKSWVTHRASLPAQVVHESQYRHLLPTPATIRSQSALRAMQGQGGVWFAGGYTLPYDSQETALLSAMSVADGIAAGSAARLRARRPEVR